MGDSSRKMKITDLNIDCLESVFEYLEFSDLLSVASSNKRLNKAANFVYVREHSNKRVYFENTQLLQCRFFRIRNLFISIHDVRTSLQFIRCFGHLVSKVYFFSSGQKSCELHQHVINYINEYCSDSLTSIDIHHPTSIEWEHFENPFSKIEELILLRCHVVDKNSFNRLFPKMKTLHANLSGNDKSFFVNANHFPYLERLGIKGIGYMSSLLCGETIAPILRLNPQLVHLGVHAKRPLFDSADFQNAVKALQNLEKLTLSVPTLSTKPFDSEICLNNVKTFTIYSVTKIPFLFGQLGTLTLFGSQLPSDFFNFIDKHPKIKDLKLYVESLSVTDQSKITKSLPLLHSISFGGCKISANEAIHFMSNFENLSRFTFFINDTTAYEDFQARFSTEWDCKIYDREGVDMERIVPQAKKRKTVSKYV